MQGMVFSRPTVFKFTNSYQQACVYCAIKNK